MAATVCICDDQIIGHWGLNSIFRPALLRGQDVAESFNSLIKSHGWFHLKVIKGILKNHLIDINSGVGWKEFVMNNKRHPFQLYHTYHLGNPRSFRSCVADSMDKDPKIYISHYKSWYHRPKIKYFLKMLQKAALKRSTEVCCIASDFNNPWNPMKTM